MAQKERCIVLADCEKAEVQSLADALEYKASAFEIESYISNWKRTGKWSEIRRYLTYFWVAFKYFIKRNHYSCIVGWQQFYALIICFYCSLFSVEKAGLIVALNFTYKEKHGGLARIYRWFMRRCVDSRYLDYIHVLSQEYADSVSEQFGFPKERIIVCPFGIDDHYDEMKNLATPNGCIRNGYALAIGRSNRDYDFLIRAWEGIDYPLFIISDTYKGKTANSKIRILTDVAGEEQYPWIVNCGLMIIPIDNETICSGDTVLLTGMMMKRRIVVTAPSTLAEMYVQDRENAFLSPKNENQFKEVVRSAVAGECENLGEMARKHYLDQFSRKSMGERITKLLAC